MEIEKDVIYMYIKENSEIDIEKVMKDYTGYIWSIIKNSGFITCEDTEEIISDVFLVLWNNRKKLDINKKMSSYICGITKNLIKKKFRNIHINDNIEDFEEKMVVLENIDIKFIRNEANRAILKELEKMKNEDKEIFLSFYYYSRKIKEIAIEFNISESKVKTKLYRIRKKIKKYLIEGGYRYE